MKIGDLVWHEDGKDELGIIIEVDTVHHLIRVRWMGGGGRIRWEEGSELERAV
tara:strand:+ start:252 stop:410 length:159 start_codon:yes stop_codon:yes gene_type:complete